MQAVSQLAEQKAFETLVYIHVFGSLFRFHHPYSHGQTCGPSLSTVESFFMFGPWEGDYARSRFACWKHGKPGSMGEQHATPCDASTTPRIWIEQVGL